jgi:hypothetical protein
MQMGRCQNIEELTLAGTGLTWQVFSQTMPNLPLRKLSLKGSTFRIGPVMGRYDWPPHPAVSDPDLLPDLFPGGSRLQANLTSLNLSDCRFYHRASIPGARGSSEDAPQEAQVAWLCGQLIPHRGRGTGAWNLKKLRLLGTDPLLTPTLFLQLMLGVPRLDLFDVATQVAAIDPGVPQELYASVREFLEGEEEEDIAIYNTERDTDDPYLSDEAAGRCFRQAQAFVAPETILTIRPPSELRGDGAEFVFSGLTFTWGVGGRALSLGDLRVPENCTAHELLVHLRGVVTRHLQVDETTRFKFLAGTSNLSSVPPYQRLRPPANPADICVTWPFAGERAERESGERAERESGERAERESRERAERKSGERAERERRERAESCCWMSCRSVQPFAWFVPRDSSEFSDGTQEKTLSEELTQIALIAAPV